MSSDALVIVVAVIAGGVAAVTGFGIGSLLTPLLALQVETSLAVAAVSIPHVIGTALRFWLLKGGLDRRVFWSFGLTTRSQSCGQTPGVARAAEGVRRWRGDGVWQLPLIQLGTTARRRLRTL